MRRTLNLAALAILMFACSGEARAEGFLIKGGLAFSSVSDAESVLTEISNIKGATQWEAGIGYQTGTWAGFCFQPELLYRSKGLNYETFADEEQKLRWHNLELPLNVQWGLDLLVMRPFIFVAPYIGINLASTLNGEKLSETSLEDAVGGFQYGLGLGVGVDISKFQVTAKYNWDFGSAVSWGDYWESVTGIETSTGAFEVAVAIIF